MGVGHVEAHPVLVAFRLHVADEGLLDFPVEPQVALAVGIALVELHEIEAAEPVENRHVVPQDGGPHLNAHELRGQGGCAPLAGLPDEVQVGRGADADDERAEAERCAAGVRLGDPANGLQALHRGWHAPLHLAGLLLVEGDDAEFEIPVTLPPDQGHIALILGPPRRLRREAQRVVDLLEEAEQFKGLSVLALIPVELVRQAAPLHHAALLDVGCELTCVLVRLPEHLLDVVHVDGADLL